MQLLTELAIFYLCSEALPNTWPRPTMAGHIWEKERHLIKKKELQRPYMRS